MANPRKFTKEIPSEVTNSLLHLKENEGKREEIILPYTTYMNVMNAPKVVGPSQAYNGAPFHLLKTGEVELDDQFIQDICGNILPNN